MRTARTGRSLILASLAVVLAFLASTGYTKWVASKIRIDTIGLHVNAVPSARHLVAARAELFQMAISLEGPATDGSAVRRERRDLSEALANYVSQPFYPGESQLYAEATRALDAFDTRLERLERDGILSNSDQRTLLGDLERVDTAIGRLVVFNIDHANQHATRIEEVWQRSLDIEIGLDVLCVLLAITATLLAFRAIRRYTRFLEERASALEDFSARMAHDVLSPLSTVGLVVPMLERRTLDDGQAQALARRATSSLQRVRTLVDDLLAFARAGAQPDPNASTDVKPVVEGIMGELGGQAAESNIALVAEPLASCQVACSPGVLTSLLSNLVRNAIKFMGDRPERRVQVRVTCPPDRVRVEVEDTGPGLPPGYESQIFEPYFRGPKPQQPGVGLGLAIVKRLAEALGGAVGVRSPVKPEGGGSIFWFELPRVAELQPSPSQPAA